MRLRIIGVSALLCLAAACGDDASREIPLHDHEALQTENDLAPTGLKVFRASGPSRLSVGAAWTLRAAARDPEGGAVRYRWLATSGALSAVQGQTTVWTATETIGRAEIQIEALDPAGNTARAAFAVAVPPPAPAGPVEDIRDDVGYHCSLGFDTNDNPHIAYYDSTHPSLKYAEWTGTEWQIETIEGYGLDIGGAAGRYASLAFDDDGDAHVAYLVDYAGEDELSLNYATRSGGSWSLVTVDQAEDSAWFSVTLRINPATDKPEMLYRGPDDDAVRHAVCSGTCTQAASWLQGTVYVENRGQGGYDRAYPGGFAIAQNGTRHATVDARYYDTNWDEQGVLLYATHSGGAWDSTEAIILERPTSDRDDDDAARLALDRNGQPLVLTANGIYHRLAADDWNLSRVESSGVDSIGSHARFDLACDRNRTPPSTGVVWLTSFHGSAMELVKTNDRGYFEYTYIGDCDTSSRAKTSIALDASGGAHLCWVSGSALHYQ